MEKCCQGNEKFDSKDENNEQVKCLQKVDTLLNADSVEFCPFPDFEHILLCGTYKLDESLTTSEVTTTLESPENVKSTPKAQTRHGAVKVFTIQPQHESQPLQEITSLDMCGVLDIKWPQKPPAERTIFGLVDAEGHLQILELKEDQTTLNLVEKAKLSDSSLGLSLEWSHCVEENSYHIACSDSAGFVTVYDMGEGLNISSQWSAHGYEAWITAFHQFNNNIVYSGGDDCLLKTWDRRDTSRPVLVSRCHQMGVCSIQSHPLDENIFASGSYDEQLFIWDRRNPRRPLTETLLGGGVWRIKWEPYQGKHILTATMYNGTHIVDCDDLEKNPLPILAEYNDHNLAYGADWCRLSNKSSLNCRASENIERTNDQNPQRPFIISTCSFYDHSLHLLEWNGK